MLGSNDVLRKIPKTFYKVATTGYCVADANDKRVSPICGDRQTLLYFAGKAQEAGVKIIQYIELV